MFTQQLVTLPFAIKLYIYFILLPFIGHLHFIVTIFFKFHFIFMQKLIPQKKKKKGCHQVLVLLHRIVCTGIANETPPQTVFSFPINTSREGKAIFISYNLSCHRNAPFYRAVAGVET